MSNPNISRRKIRPTHPGEMLREDFMPDYKLTVTSLAEKIDVSRQTINELINEDRAVSSAMALKLSRLFGNTPEFWLNAQLAVELWEAERRCGKDLERIRMLKAG
ncbi:MAG: addiction module antidote protein, HigA family [Deltaproteobacteria bacterium RIFCSPLOWO2_02_FULL_53_8]|nr:MAG: addiction module antidote protein, HigA family [Deltaproteobacteria bacterium RIFCSPLOWO2_02_FULL_53_8]